MPGALAVHASALGLRTAAGCVQPTPGLDTYDSQVAFVLLEYYSITSSLAVGLHQFVPISIYRGSQVAFIKSFEAVYCFLPLMVKVLFIGQVGCGLGATLVSFLVAVFGRYFFCRSWSSCSHRPGGRADVAVVLRHVLWVGGWRGAGCFF